MTQGPIQRGEVRWYVERRGPPSLRWRILLVVLAALGIGYLFWQPGLPIDTTFRPAIGGNSEVAQFHNSSNKYLAVRAVFENSGLHQRRQALLNIGPYKTVEFGWLEGWSFLSGEHVLLASDGYRAKAFTVP
jgi:hypothetical protein